MNKLEAYLMASASLILGMGSLVLYLIFILSGPFILTDLGLSRSGALAVDVLLSLIFFLQHSLLPRKGIKNRIMKVIPEKFYRAFYSITSGIALIMAVGLWQGTAGIFLRVDSWGYWLIRASFILSLLGLAWGEITLAFSFDPYGVMDIMGWSRKFGGGTLKIRGAFRWVRHPLYFFTLIMIWSCPVLTEDRLLFNLLWSAWIVIGAYMEERNLIRDFGEQYREYQSRVPMLIPYRIPPETDTHMKTLGIE